MRTEVSFIAVLGLVTGIAAVVVVSVILIGLGFANIFPSVFSITIDSMPEKTNELSRLMITAIVGGAFIPPVMGLAADNTSVTAGFIIPSIALVYIGWTALKDLKIS